MLIQEDKIHESWKNLLTPEFLRELEHVEQQIGNNFYPVSDKVMRFLETDLSNAKCVIIGMEPYPSYYMQNGEMIPVATGRSFEIANVTDWGEPYKQTSLRNILKTVYYNKTGEKKSLDEIREEIAQEHFRIAQPPEWFDSMEQQGVIFLNATLTVRKGTPDSHTVIWKKAMDMIIRYIDENANVKWLLFGNKAVQRVTETLGEKKNIKKYSHPRNFEFISENPFKDVPGIRWTGICRKRRG